MDGNVINEWSTAPLDVEYVRMKPDGNLLAISRNLRLWELDWDSNVVWSMKGKFHHDIWVETDGRVYAMSRKDRIVSFHGIPLPVRDDIIVVCDRRLL